MPEFEKIFRILRGSDVDGGIAGVSSAIIVEIEAEVATGKVEIGFAQRDPIGVDPKKRAVEPLEAFEDEKGLLVTVIFPRSEVVSHFDVVIELERLAREAEVLNFFFVDGIFRIKRDDLHNLEDAESTIKMQRRDDGEMV